MSTNPNIDHVGAERMQALLDGGLGEPEARTVREHVSACARCRSQLDGWTTLYRRLGNLREIAPSPGFAARVLEALPDPAPEPMSLAARIRAWLTPGRRSEALPAIGHLDAGAVQELLDGVLPPQRASAIEAHLGGCRACRDEVAGWRGLMVRLDRLNHLAPSPLFTERVLAHVRVQNAMALGRPSLGERLANWLALNPRTRKRLAALAGAGVTPAVTVALVTWSVFSHPLVTPTNLASFLWLKAQSLVTGLAGAVAGQLTETAGALGIYAFVEPLTRSAEAAAAAVAILGILTVISVWILYRNLFPTTSAEGGYA